MATRDLELMEAPGGAGPFALCPNCSRMYKAHLMEPDPTDRLNPGKERAVVNYDEVPTTCRRCGSPMDIEAQVSFSEKQAVQAAAGPGRAGRRSTQVVMPDSTTGVPRIMRTKDMKVDELKAELGAWDQSSEGTREELVTRLDELRVERARS
jgi:hypothetical protein